MQKNTARLSFLTISQMYHIYNIIILRIIFLICSSKKRTCLELYENVKFINSLFCEINESRCDIYMHGISNSSVAQSRALLSLKFSSSPSYNVTSWIAIVAVLHNQQIFIYTENVVLQKGTYIN